MKNKMIQLDINKLSDKQLKSHLDSINRILKDPTSSEANSAMFYADLINTAKEIEKKLNKTKNQKTDIEKQHHEALNKTFVEINYILKLQDKPNEKIKKIKDSLNKIENIDNKYYRYIAKKLYKK